ncbi:MAG: LL-diaminopimelate aminotransferase [Chloroflexi bacterium RBG_16_48_7]|nr:MAG: LL-diaminopimelate aminotransferase [Chloroflexi bacterium RBG_16_48_7]
MKVAGRIEKLPPYLFVEISKKIAEKKAKGIDVVSFGIGDPDMPTPERIIEKLCEQAHNPGNHRYPETEGLPELNKAIADWYKKRFGVELVPGKETLPLLGSKEGIGHISFCFIDRGDTALITDPGYPVYSISTQLAGGEVFYLPISEKNSYLPDLDKVPADVLKKTKLLWLNYPNNPTGAVAGPDFYEKAVQFARKNGILICHDAPYSEVAFDGFKPGSILQVSGSRDVAIEFHSLSKTYNMTGWRIGMAVGNSEMVNALYRLKTNLDSGIPQAIQYMAIEALNGSDSEVQARNDIYCRRRDKLCEALDAIGLKFSKPHASFYVWAGIPQGYTSASFAKELLEKVNIVVTPGTGYGPSGEGYIRFSITLPDGRLDEGIKRLRQWKKNK